jgi:hypothetical protein
METNFPDEITDILALTTAIRKESSTTDGSIWFRGQARHEWKLVPSLLRSNAQISESSLLARFKQNAAMLTSGTPGNSFDWIFLMQHYGVPTRLLDWTENPLVALYFALENHSGNTPATLWMLHPAELNKQSGIEETDEVDYIPSFDDQEVQQYSTEQVRIDTRLKLNPIATIATRNNPRIQAQHGTFTIHHNHRKAIEEVGDGAHCKKFTIPADAIKGLQEDLSLLGINRFSLFPEMESIGVKLKELL